RPPAEQLIGGVPADEHIVGDVEILRSRPVVLHATAHILDARAQQREAAGPADVLVAEQEADLGVPDRYAFETSIIGGHEVEEIVIAAAIEDHLPVARRPDGDGLLRRAL